MEVESISFTGLATGEILTVGSDYSISALMADDSAGDNKDVSVKVVLKNARYSFSSNKSEKIINAKVNISMPAVNTKPNKANAGGVSTSPAGTVASPSTGSKSTSNNSSSGGSVSGGNTGTGSNTSSATDGNAGGSTANVISGGASIVKPNTGGNTSSGTSNNATPSVGNTGSASLSTGMSGISNEEKKDANDKKALKDSETEKLKQKKDKEKIEQEKARIEKVNKELREKHPNNIVVAGKVFLDTKADDWYADSVKFVSENKLMTGTSDSSFSPNDNTTRAMIATMLYRLSKDESNHTKNSFKDVAKATWYYDGVSWAKGKNIVNGYDDFTFGADDSLSREQLVSIMYRYAKYKNLDTKLNNDKYLTKFTDFSEVSDYALEPMKWAVANGIITGTSDETLSPKDGATRAQMASIFMRFIEKFETR